MSGDTGGGQPGPKGNPKRPRQLKRARVGWPPALRELKELLYEVYLAADAPSLDEITGGIAADDGLAGSPERDTIHRVITDGERTGQQADVVAVATVLARRAAWDAPDLAGRVRDLWVRARMAQGAGRPIGDLRGDVRLVMDGGLGVHPALDTGGARDRFGILPAYVPRDHDARLKTVINAAAESGHSGIAVLVGGSSTGKTRALWEAVAQLPDTWRLWHPLSPTAPDAALAALEDIAPKTVLWLNEAQHYLAPDPLGEQVAAGLRELLHDPSRAPVLVLGTLWPEHWDSLTTRTTADRHAGARELLGGHKIDVPDTFTPTDLAALDATDDADPRLIEAGQHAKGAQVTQYLAGVPYLMDRYEAARGATLALIHAAMDACRMGAGPHLPLDWLADAAPGYLDDDEYRVLDGDWLSQALTYVTTPCNGIPGILTPVTNSAPRNQRARWRPVMTGTFAEQPSPGVQGPRYLLADYLDQHGRRHRIEQIPPIDFWKAAAHHAHPADLKALGGAAWGRGLYRDAVQLQKNATLHRAPDVPAALVRRLRHLHPTDLRPAQWVAIHASLDSPEEVAGLLKELREAGAHESATALAARLAVTRVPRDFPYAVARLLEELRKVGSHKQVTTLATRAATHVAMDDPSTVINLLEELRKAGAHKQVTTLATRAVTHVAMDDPSTVMRLLKSLREAEAHEQAMTLASRAAAYASLDKPSTVINLLEELRKAGAHKQVTTLATRAVTHVAMDDPSTVMRLLKSLREAEAHEQATTLLARNPAAHASLDNPYEVAWLLKELQEDGAHDQASALLARDPAIHVHLRDLDSVIRLLQGLRKAGAHEQTMILASRAVDYVSFGNPGAVIWLLEGLMGVGAWEQAMTLASRAAAHAPVDDPDLIAWLLKGLWKVRVHEQATALASRAAAHAPLDNPHAVCGLLEVLRTVEAQEQIASLLARNPATHVSLDDPRAVTRLLKELRENGALEQIAALLACNPATHVSLGRAHEVANLLKELRENGAHEQIAALASRIASHVSLDDPRAVTRLLEELRENGALEQIAGLLARNPATHVSLDDPYAVSGLLQALSKAGAHEQVMVLASRAAAHAPLDNAHAVCGLLQGLRTMGVHEQAIALATRAAHIPLDDPRKVAELLNELREAGAHEQAITLLARDPAIHVALDDPSKVFEVDRLVRSLREAGAHKQASTLAARLPSGGHFDLFIKLCASPEQFRLGREPDGSPAPSWTWDDLE